VAQRQVGNHGIRRCAAVDRVHPGGHGVDVAIGNHRRLRPAGGAGSENHEGDVVFGLACEALLDQTRLLPLESRAERRDCFKGIKTFDLVVPQAGWIDDHQVGELGQARAHLQHLVDLLLIFADDHAGIGGLQQVLDLGRRRSRVDADRDGSDHAMPELREHPFLAVFADDGGVASLRQASFARPRPKCRARRSYSAQL